MPGFTSVTSGQSVMFADNVCFDGTARTTLVNADGQLLIGSSVSPFLKPALLTSTGGTISITNGHNSINLESNSLTWSDKIISFNALANNGYFIAASVTATLPASPANGTTIAFFIDGAFTLTLQANTGQTIQISSNISSASGTQSNTTSGDSVTLVYRSTDTKWVAISFVGAWNFT